MTRRFFPAVRSDVAPAGSVDISLRLSPLASADSVSAASGRCASAAGARFLTSRMLSGAADESADIEIIVGDGFTVWLMVIADAALCSESAWSVLLEYEHAHAWSLDVAQYDASHGIVMIELDSDALPDDHGDEHTEISITVTAGTNTTTRIVYVYPPPPPITPPE